MTPLTMATNRKKLIEKESTPNISRKVTNVPIAQIQSRREFHMRRSALTTSMTSMVRTASSGRQCC